METIFSPSASLAPANVPFSPSNGLRSVVLSGAPPPQRVLYEDGVGKKSFVTTVGHSTSALTTKRYHTGYLNQRTIAVGFIKSWKKRFFRLRDDGLICYQTKENTRPRYEVMFTEHTVVTWHMSSKPFSFEISHVEILDKMGSWIPPEDPIVLQAQNEADRSEWIAFIRGKLEHRKWKIPTRQSSEWNTSEAIFSPEPTPKMVDPEEVEVMDTRDSSPSSDARASLRSRLSKVLSSVAVPAGGDQSTKQTSMEGQPSGGIAEYDRFHAKYLLSREVGEGSFSVVRQGTDRKTGELFAVKCTKTTSSLVEEVRILRRLDSHPHIVGLHEFFDCGDDLCYVVMDYMRGGDLCDKLMEVKKYSEVDARVILTKIVQALSFCHDQYIVHRDIKPENILLDSVDNTLYVKLADFGLAKQLSSPSSVIKKTCGTPEYAAPELLEGKPYGLPSDVFSLGVVLYIMLIGTFPFSMESAAALQNLERFTEGKDVRNMSCLALNSVQWKDVSSLAKDLILRMLDENPATRITCSQILKHPYLSHQKDRISCIVPLKNAQLQEQRRLEEVRFEGFQNLLKHGVYVIKYGRKGSPHMTKLKLEVDENGGINSRLLWRSKAHKIVTGSSEVVGGCSPKKEEDVVGPGPEGDRPSSNQENEFVTEDNGGEKVVSRRVGMIRLVDIVEVVEGRDTEVFRRYSSAKKAACFSIVTSKRTLDLEATSEELKECLFKGLERLVREKMDDIHASSTAPAQRVSLVPEDGVHSPPK